MTSNKRFFSFSDILLCPLTEKTSYSIILLRVIATCLITNTHFNNVYPTEALAVGGLIGDVLFFFISGYCYGNGVKSDFGTWYMKRWIRIYPSIFIMTLICILTGFVSVPANSFTNMSLYFFVENFILPTPFVFFGAIMILYIPLYFCSKLSVDSTRILLLSWLLVYMLYYLLFTDKSVYFMNDTGNFSILFLYFGSMILGIAVKKGAFRITSNKVLSIILTLVFAVLYYLADTKIRSNPKYFIFQILIPLSLLLFSTTFSSTVLLFENAIRKIPSWLMTFFRLVAFLTLEIYVVQKIIIPVFEKIFFPLNWFVIVAFILFAAILLKIAVHYLTVYLPKKHKS